MVEYEHADLRGSRFNDVDLRESDLRGVYFKDVVMKGCVLDGVEIEAEIRNLVINGVDVAPLVEAELDRRDPDRATMRPTDPDGFRDAWDVVERLWAGTVERARGFAPEQLHESVDGEWSFIETLRHLAFATDAWVAGLSSATPTPGTRSTCRLTNGGHPGCRATARSGRRSTRCCDCATTGWRTVRHVVDGLTPDSLAARPSRSRDRAGRRR